MEETVSITHHSSLAVSQNRFIFFPVFGEDLFLSPVAARVMSCQIVTVAS